MAQANELDLLGGGSASGTLGGLEGRAGTDLTPEQIADTMARKKAWLASQGLDANGNQLPAYGTPTWAGGTATGSQVTTQPTVGTGNMRVVDRVPLGATGAPDVGATSDRSTFQTGGAPNQGAGPGGLVNVQSGIVPPDISSQYSGGGRGSQIVAQTANETMQLRDQIQASGASAANGLALTADAAANMNPLTNRGLTSTAAEQARTALGPAPTIDQNLADRNSGQVSEAVQQAGQVVDKALAPVGQKNVNSAMSAARNVLDQALNGPDTTARIGAQTLRNQLALARSASGGAGAAQQAIRDAQFAAPELLSQASDAGIREQAAKLGIASQQTGQLAQTALGQQQNTTQRLDVAAKAAGTSAQAAQGQRGQDIEMAKANLDAGVNLANQISQLTGQQLQLNQQNQELLGNMARDLAKTQFDYSQLDAQTQDAEFERWIKAYGIDVAAAAQIKAAAQANDKGVMDYLMPIIGGLGAAAL